MEVVGPGKWEWAVRVESYTPQTALGNNSATEQVLSCDEATREDIVLEPANSKCTPASGEGALPEDVVVIPDTLMYNEHLESKICDLYAVGRIREDEGEHKSVPFVHGVELGGPRGETVMFRSVFDDGAMVNAIDAGVYDQVKARLTALKPSSKLLRMADGCYDLS